MPTQVEQRHRDAVSTLLAARVEANGFVSVDANLTVLHAAKQEMARLLAQRERLVKMLDFRIAQAAEGSKPWDSARFRDESVLLSEIEEETR